MIAIVDFNTGNVNSVKNMLTRIGVASEITNDKSVISQATKIILPGVGHFDFGMQNLKNLGLVDLLTERVIVDKVPVLGICLGAQLMTEGSEEGVSSGLGWIKGFTKAFDRDILSAPIKVPHMGWSDVVFRDQSKLFSSFSETPRFYFVHSYHMVCSNPINEMVYCTYGYEFVAGIEHDNIVGVQFHPEKSHQFGMQLIKNFVNNY